MKKTKNLIYLAVLCLISLSVASCNSDDDYIDQVKNKTDWTTISNMNNPYDYEGFEHNHWLDSIMQASKTQDTTDTDFDESVRFSCMYLHSRGFDTTGLYNNIYNCIDDLDSCFFNVIENNNYLSRNAKYCIESTILEVLTLHLSQSYFIYTPFYNLIYDKENSIMDGDSKLTQSDIVKVLSFLSTLRYSLYYWDIICPSQNASKKTITSIADAIGTLIGGRTLGISLSYLTDKHTRNNSRISISIDDNDMPIITL